MRRRESGTGSVVRKEIGMGNEIADLTTATVADFLSEESLEAEGRALDRQLGTRIFFRNDDYARERLLGALIDAWLDDKVLNRDMTGGFFRQSWDSEPYLDGLRAGSFFSAVAAHTPGDPIWMMSEIAETWGDAMMTAEERARLEALAFPITMYRGGTGSLRELSLGVSWTLDLATARFYAEAWPQRWGRVETPAVLSLQVNRDNVTALLDDRSEAEILLADPYGLSLQTKRLDLSDGVQSENAD